MYKGKLDLGGKHPAERFHQSYEGPYATPTKEIAGKLTRLFNAFYNAPPTQRIQEYALALKERAYTPREVEDAAKRAIETMMQMPSLAEFIAMLPRKNTHINVVESDDQKRLVRENKKFDDILELFANMCTEAKRDPEEVASKWCKRWFVETYGELPGHSTLTYGTFMKSAMFDLYEAEFKFDKALEIAQKNRISGVGYGEVDQV